MKLLKFADFVNESTTHFDRTFDVDPSWWTLWADSHEDEYKISQDAFSKSYSIKKDGIIIAIYDYARNKVFTNEHPDFINIDSKISPTELIKAVEVDPADPDGLIKKEKEKEDEESKEKDPVDDILSK